MDVEIAVRSTATLGEGPIWDAEAESLNWVDILAGEIHRFDPVAGQDSITTLDQHVGAVRPRASGGLVANLADGVAVLDSDGSLHWLLRWVSDVRGNDAAVDPAGRLWAGTMRYDRATGGGTLTRIEPSGAHTVVLPHVSISNGIAWSPDGNTMYYVDSPTHRIDMFDYDRSTGAVARRRPFAEITQSPEVLTGYRSTPTARYGWR